VLHAGWRVKCYHALAYVASTFHTRVDSDKLLLGKSCSTRCAHGCRDTTSILGLIQPCNEVQRPIRRVGEQHEQLSTPQDTCSLLIVLSHDLLCCPSGYGCSMRVFLLLGLRKDPRVCCRLRWKLLRHSTSTALLLAPPVKQMIGSLRVCSIPCARLPFAHPPHHAPCAHAPLDRAGSSTSPPWSDTDETCCCRCRFTPAVPIWLYCRISHGHWHSSASSGARGAKSEECCPHLVVLQDHCLSMWELRLVATARERCHEPGYRASGPGGWHRLWS
jgi:hypothetical protein